MIPDIHVHGFRINVRNDIVVVNLHPFGAFRLQIFSSMKAEGSRE